MEKSIPDSQINAQLREEAVSEVLKEQTIRRRKLSAFDFVKEVSKKFIELQIDNFPTLCDIARVQNKLKWDDLILNGKKGKYTGSSGWSEKGDFKFEYEIPEELYLFMVNLVYTDFWSNENRKVWREFMKRICRGEDAMQTLMWAKMIYGSNAQENAVVSGGTKE